MSTADGSVASVPSGVESVHTGTTFTKTAIGWDVKWVDGGTVQYLQVPTITEVLRTHGPQVVAPVVEIAEPGVEVPAVTPDVPPAAEVVADERRAPDQDAAIETAFAAGVLPEVDRRDEGDE